MQTFLKTLIQRFRNIQIKDGCLNTSTGGEFNRSRVETKRYNAKTGADLCVTRLQIDKVALAHKQTVRHMANET